MRSVAPALRVSRLYSARIGRNVQSRLETNGVVSTEIAALQAEIRSLKELVQEQHQAQAQTTNASSSKVTTSASSNNDKTIPQPPTPTQLRNVFLGGAIPMMAFGFMDQSVMIQAGNVIDCTLGVWFGLSTLAAAAIGQVISAAAAAIFGGTVDGYLRSSFGIPRPTGLTSQQRRLKSVEKVKYYGSFVGVVMGCCLGLVHLLLIDTEKSTELKWQALSEEQEFAFEVEANNTDRTNATTFKIRGPDVDGLLASLTSALTARQCSLVEMIAEQMPNANDNQDNGAIQDVFVVRRNGKQVPDDELDELAKELLEATRDPTNVHLIKAQIKEVEETNETLRSRVQRLEQELEEKQISIVTRRNSPSSE